MNICNYFVTEHLSRRRGSARRCQGSGEGEAQARRTTRVNYEQTLYSVILKLNFTNRCIFKRTRTTRNADARSLHAGRVQFVTDTDFSRRT